MPRARIVLAIASAWALALLAPLGAWAQTLSVGPTGRYLVDHQGQPAFLQGDTGWSLFVELNTDDAATYLHSRSAAGFNVVMASLIEHQFASNPPFNAYGEAPFTGRPFATPNEAYFSHVDSILAIAEQSGITVLMSPLYLGYDCGSEGWCAEVQAATTEEMQAWGDFVGARYAYAPNIIWLLGGDVDPSPVAPQMLAFVNAVLAHDSTHPWSAHNQPETWASDAWPGQDWLTLNSFYTYSASPYEWAQNGRAMTPTRPFFLLESTFENEHNATPQQLRAAAYYTVIWGGCGHIFGNCPMWHFGSMAGWCGSTDWRAALASPGTVSMTWVQRLFTSRHWWLLEPDDNGAVLTGGAGTFGQSDYVVAAGTSDGSSIIAYLPQKRTVTIDLTSIGPGPVRAWWFRPKDGATTLVGDFPASSRSFNPPSSGDWVLVVDNLNFAFPAPGSTDIPAAVGGRVPVSPLNLVIAPNPLRVTGRLRLHLAAEGVVQVKLLDLAGRERLRLPDVRRPAGPTDLTLDTRGLEPGLYWCQVRAGARTEQRPVVVVR